MSAWRCPQAACTSYWASSCHGNPSGSKSCATTLNQIPPGPSAHCHGFWNLTAAAAQVLQDVSLEVPPGSLHILLGPDGCGNSGETQSSIVNFDQVHLGHTGMGTRS